ncbi:MAG: hypothetical protein K2I81_03670 [Alphaproteobacteria bacterium]|nr:hypothetical protein [Alphaproteobacteria bacterium]
MKLYKKVVPYLILGSAAMFSNNSANAQKIEEPDLPKPKLEMQVPNELIAKNTSVVNTVQPYTIVQSRLMARAETTCGMYIENMLAAQKRLQPKIGTRGYRTAVRKELPGAPVGLHCMYGQYTQLMRALNENGDTLAVIPDGGKSACVAFKDQMRRKYTKPEYAGAIKEGRAFESDSAYNAELGKYLARRGIGDSTDIAKRDAAIAEFAKHNFSLAHVNPGSIMIVPRFRGSKNKFHAIMFLGEGRIESGEFMPDATGKYMFTAHNRERIGDIVKNWDMSNVFSADIEQILQVEYAKELKRLESMSREQMIEYISTGTEIAMDKLLELPRPELIRLVHAKYFGDDVQKALSAPATPAQIAMQHQLQISRS